MKAQASLPLRDIHLPDAVSWWPPAIGWWVTLVLVIVLLVVVAMLIKRWTQPVVKKSATREWRALTDAYAKDHDQLKLLQSLSVLLRRIGISYLARNEVAGLTGKDWYQRLNALSKGQPFSDQSIRLLSDAPYRINSDIPPQQLDELLQQTQQWLAGLAREARHD